MDVEIIESERLKAAVLNINTNTSRTFIAAVAAEIDTPEKAALISSSKALEMRFERAKSKLNTYPKIPTTYPEMLVTHPNVLKATYGGGRFLRHEGFITSSESEASWMYVSDSGVDQLIRTKVWCIDGTFSSAPLPFKQIVSVNIITATGVGFLAFCRKDCYHVLFRKKCPSGLVLAKQQDQETLPRRIVQATLQVDARKEQWR